MTGSNDFCLGHVISGPDPQTAGDPATHQYTVQAWSIAGTGKYFYKQGVVVERPDMGVNHFPLGVGDPIYVSIVGAVVRVTTPIGKADWLDCGG